MPCHKNNKYRSWCHWQGHQISVVTYHDSQTVFQLQKTNVHKKISTNLKMICPSLSKTWRLFGENLFFKIPKKIYKLWHSFLLSLAKKIASQSFSRPKNNSAGINLIKVNNKNAWTICETYSKLTKKTLQRRHWHRTGAFLWTLNRLRTLLIALLILSK